MRDSSVGRRQSWRRLPYRPIFCTRIPRLLREVLCLVFVVLLLVANSVVIVWTALGTHGGGPISGPVTSRVWRMALALHKRRPNHRMLSFAGSAILVVLITLWISILLGGWFCIFSAKPDAVVNAITRHPATAINRFCFAANTVSTMGNAEFSPNGALWRFLTSIAGIT